MDDERFSRQAIRQLGPSGAAGEMKGVRAWRRFDEHVIMGVYTRLTDTLAEFENDHFAGVFDVFVGCVRWARFLRYKYILQLIHRESREHIYRVSRRSRTMRLTWLLDFLMTKFMKQVVAAEQKGMSGTTGQMQMQQRTHEAFKSSKMHRIYQALWAGSVYYTNSPSVWHSPDV